MENSQLSLYLEINRTNYIFYVNKNDSQNNSNIVHETKVTLEGFANNSI